MRAPDHFDIGEDNVVRFHTYGKPHPLGHNSCERCLVLSPLYDLFPSCRSCQEELCPEHQAAGSQRDDDGRESCLCQRCAEERTCESCGAEDVDTRTVQVGDGRSEPRYDERHCQRCSPKAWATQEAWEGRYEAI
jgi:hypothetical protein